MTAVVSCAECGHVWEVSREQIISGGWQDCPNCTPAADDEPGDDETSGVVG